MATSQPDLRIVRAAPGDVPAVVTVLDHAAARLAAAGIRQWPPRFDPDWVRPAVDRGETWLVWIGDRIAGTVTLDWDDQLWTDHPGRAAYVHRLAVERWAAGAGILVLDWAAGQARDRDATAVRLDCVAANAGLRAYYERAGFRHRGDVEVGGAPGRRDDGGPRTVVSRYERSVRVSPDAVGGDAGGRQ